MAEIQKVKEQDLAPSRSYCGCAANFGSDHQSVVGFDGERFVLLLPPILISAGGNVPGIGGSGIEKIADAMRLERVQTRMLGEDLYLTGYVAK